MIILFTWGSVALAAGTAKKSKAVLAAVSVNVAKVSLQNIPQTVAALGSLSAQKAVLISAQENGQVGAIYFKDGQRVGAGMPILQQDNTQAKANYAQAVTTYQVAKQKYQRSKTLLNTAISAQELATLKADMDSKEAAMKDAQDNLNHLRITAPFNGVLGAFKIKSGDYVQQGSPLVSVVDTTKLQVKYNVPEDLLPKLKQGQLVMLKVSAYPKKVFYGTVTYVAPMVNQSMRSVAIEALVPNKKAVLSPGMFVHVEQQVGVAKHALVVPAVAVLADVKGYYVYKIIGTRVSKTYVKVGTRLPGKVQILAGLNQNDTVVTAGQQKLQDGSTVTIS